MTVSTSYTYDAIIVGAGVSGVATAILLAQAGLRVALVDGKRDVAEYKTLCTHFVQPFANQVFHDLGAAALLDPDHSVATKAAFRVPGGQIDTDADYGSDPVSAAAHNLERRVMDPFLRQRARDCGVTLMLGTNATALDSTGADHALQVEGEVTGTLHARHLIAGDGRLSFIARLLDAPATLRTNDRATYFAYCDGIAAPDRNRSIFVLNNAEMSFLYPLIGGRTLLSVYIKADRIAEWGSGRTAWPKLVAQFAKHIPDMDFTQARAETPVRGYKRYPNQIRTPVHRGVGFVGDAAASLDPMSGVGCSFGLKSARLMADAILTHGADRDAALADYAKTHHDFFTPHIDGICADSLVTKSDSASQDIYRVILGNEKLKQRYLDLTARLITPAAFQKSYLFAAAAASRSKRQPESV